MERWGNYIVTFLLGFANVEQIPVQIHTGLALMEHSNPTNLVELTRLFGGVKFAFFHGSYPWHTLLPGIIYSRENVWADLCWMPILNQDATGQIMNDLISLGRSYRILGYGGDCQTMEGSIGALVKFKQILTKVLFEKIIKAKLTESEAIETGNIILSGNAREFLNLTK
jgi:predicted TIM-barrel fold metal-dependent hydrolase